MSEWKKTKHRGIRFREHATRKVGRVQRDRYYSVRYQVRGKAVETGIGWVSEGVTLDAVIEKLKQFRTNAKLSNGQPTKMKELFSEDTARRLKAVSIKEFIETHYIPHSKGTKSPGQHKKELQHCNIWLIPTIGDKRLIDLQDGAGNSGMAVILILKEAMESTGKSNRMIEHVLFSLSQVFRHGQKVGIIQPAAKFPGSEVKLSINNARQRFLTRDEAATLLSLLREQDKTLADMAEFSLLTGCRRGELFSMTWQDVSLDSASVLIRDPKNDEDRHLYLTTRAVEIIREQPIGQPQEAVFRNKKGRAYDHLPYCWAGVIKASGLNAGVVDNRLIVTWHSLRHTCASWLAIDGTDLYKIAKILGHKDLKMTQRYSHLSKDSLREALERTMK